MRISNIKSFTSLGLVFVLVILSGCSKSNSVTNPNQIVGSGKLLTEQRTVDTFTGIQVTGIGKVFVTQDSAQGLRIEADDNVIGLVTTSVSNGLLSVALKQGSYSNITVNVYASMKTINRLESVGSAEFVTAGQIQTDSIVCRITGTGSITLKGTAGFESVEITGAGNVDNFGLASSRCSAMISGTGNVEVNVTQELDAVIAGTGTIVYTGNPQVLHQTVTGVGSVKAQQ
ncbi:MAG: head GIN domain-containing protein [Bacteroidota bacterium]